MAVWVFKDSEKELIPAELLDSQLAAGWSVTDPDTVVPDEPVTEVKKDIGSSAILHSARARNYKHN